jgi:hypothetical protein
MAQKVSVVLIDDMDGGEAEGTVEFGLDGTIYEIGLSHGHSQELRDLLKSYVAEGRKVAGTARRPSRSRGTASDEARNKEMRAWARTQGLKVNERGRVPADIVARYEAANGQ